MTVSATCAIDEVPYLRGITDSYDYDAFGNKVNSTGSTPNNLLYRGEQYDSDLGLYYLRARYYNPLTGRFMSRDPEDGNLSDQVTLHKYLYAGSNPVNYVDPRGRELFEYAMESNAAIPEAKLLSIYGCVSSAVFTAASLLLEDSFDGWDLTGIAGTTIGCVTISAPPVASVSGKIAKIALKLIPALNYGFCGASMAAVVHDLNGLLSNSSTNKSMGALVDSIGTLVGCVSTRLGSLLEEEAE